MRKLFVLISLPALAAPPVSVKVLQASVTWGSGVEPKGGMPPGRFQARVCLTGGRVPIRPVFRLWCVKVGAFPGLEESQAKFPALNKSNRLVATATATAGGTWVLQGAWKGSPEADDRLIVEVRSGARRLTWTVSPLTEQLIPATGKPTEASSEDHR